MSGTRTPTTPRAHHPGRRPAQRGRPAGRVLLREDVRGFLRGDAAGESPVDREGGFIRGVRVLGLVSHNGRRYERQAVLAAMPLYEGRKVKIDHPVRPGETRPVQSVFGWLEGVYQGADGALYARKLHYLKTHEMAGPVCEAAERNPALFSLSHNAEGSGRHEDGVFVVEEITEVRSVDMVDDGATNQSLFEGRTMPRTLRQLIEASKVKAPLKARLLEMGATCEDDGLGLGGMEPSTPAGDEGEDADWKQHLTDAIAVLVDSEDEADHKMAEKILKMLKPGAAGGESADEEPTEEGEGEEKGDGKKKKTEEGRRAKASPGKTLLTESKAKKYCAVAGIEPTRDVLEAVIGGDEDQALAVLALLKRQPRTGSAPRSSGPGTVAVAEGRQPKDAREQATLLLRG